MKKRHRISVFASLFVLFSLFVAPLSQAASPQELWQQQPAMYNPDLFSGGAGYSVPIDVPQGRASLTPNIGLHYSSSNSNPLNITGAGWDFGLSRIVRDQRTSVLDLYNDGTFRLELNGQQLQLEDISLSSGEYGTYGSKVDDGSFYEIDFNADDSWTVTTKQGIQMTFGSSSASRMDNPNDSSQIYAWYLEDVRDLNDNYIAYTYYKDGAAVYPETINYTGNDTTDGPFTVRFEPFATGTPAARSDAAISYASGFEVEYQYLVNAIEVDADGYVNPVLSYDFTYITGDNGSKSLLESVTKSGLDSSGSSVSLEPWQFDYTQATDSWTNQTSSFNFAGKNYGSSGTALADYSGDGIVDVMQQVNPTTGSMFEGHADGFSDDTASWGFLTETMLERDTIIMDVNGDAATDIMRSYGTSSSQQWIFLNDGDRTFSEVSSSWTLPAIDFSDSRLLTGDINGDGLTDFVRNFNCPYCTNQVWINDGTSGWFDDSASYTLPAITFDTSYWRFVDLNNDGLADLWRSYGNGPYTEKVYLNQGDGNFLDMSSSGWSFPNLGIHNSKIADLNGDSYTDIFNGTYIWLGGASGWSVDTAYPSVPGSISSDTWKYLDFNGDGLMDAVRESCSVGCSGTAHIHDGVHPDLLQTVTAPEGGTVDFAYTSTAQLVDNSSDPANPQLPFVFPVVSSVTENDGLGNEWTTTYNYEDGRFVSTNVYDGRFGGFNKVTKTYDDGSYDITYFHQGGGVDGSAQGEYEDHWDKMGHVYRVETYDADDDLLKTIITQWEREDLGNDRAFIYPFMEGTRVYDDAGAHKDSGFAYTYDSNGNISTVLDYGNATVSDSGTIFDLGTDSRTTTYTYVTTTSPYLVGLRALETVKNYNDAFVSGRVWLYDGLAYQAATVGNMTRLGQLVSVSPVEYSLTDYGYDPYGNVTSITDPNGNETTYTIDSSWHMYPITITQPLIGDTDQTVDLVTGKVTHSVDPNGTIHEADYDTFGRVEETRISDVASAATLVTTQTYSYNTVSVPNQVAITSYSDALTSTTAYQYGDGFGRLAQTRSPMETGDYSVVETGYDARGRQSSISLPYASSGTAYTAPNVNASLIETAYDAIGRVVSVTDDVGTVTNAYDQRSKEVTDEEGNVKTYTFDARGNLVTVEEQKAASTFTTTYTYNGQNKMTRMTDNLGNIRDFTYDLLGRRLTKTALRDATSNTYGTWSYSYDDVGNMTGMTDPNGVTVTYAYDALNRRLSEDANNAAGIEIDYDYDTATNGIGKLAYVTKGGVETGYAYNERGDLASKNLTVDSSSFGATSYEYDYLGRATTTTYPNGQIATTTYNSQGQPETLTLGMTDVITDVDYNANNQPTDITFGNGVTTTNTYDASQRYWLTNRETTNGTDMLQDLAYTFDSVGDITQIVDASDLETAMTVTYGYNDLYQLTSASTTGAGSYGNYSRTYAYNSIGNMVYNSQFGAMTYADNDHPYAMTGVSGATLVYDDNGNLTSDGVRSYTWNYRNEMTSFDDGTTTTDYLYDQDGNRVRKTVNGGEMTTYIDDYVYEDNADTEEIHLSLLGQPVFEWTEEAGTTVTESWIHSDHLGSVAVMTDENGDWTTARDYYPFGDDRVYETQGTVVDDRFDFTNKERDDESGLSYFEARYLSTNFGHFISEDPWEGDIYDPQSFNKYAYARNNPVKYVDLNGKNFMTFMLSPITFGVRSAMSVVGDVGSMVLNTPIANDLYQHSLQNQPSKWSSSSDYVQNEIKQSQEYDVIQGEIIEGINSGELSGEISKPQFESGDLGWGIHGTTSATYEAQPNENGTYDVTTTITDTFNFKKEPNNSLANVINNVANVGQSLGLIQTYDVEVQVHDTLGSQQLSGGGKGTLSGGGKGNSSKSKY